MPKTKLKKKSPLPNRNSVLLVVKKPVYHYWCSGCKSIHYSTLECQRQTKQEEKPVKKSDYFNDCYWCDAVHEKRPELSSEAVKKVCTRCAAEQQVSPGPICMCSYWVNVRGRTVEDAKKICLKCMPQQDRPVCKPAPVFDLIALIASVPFPRFTYGTDAAGIASGDWVRRKGNGDSSESSQNGPSFPRTLGGKGIPAPIPTKRKEGHVLQERRPVAVPTVDRDGKKPKIVLCGQRYGLSYIFLWMGSAGWTHTDLETFCDKLDLVLPSPNTTQSRLRAGKQNNDCYGTVPKLSKKQAELMSNTITKRRK